METTDKTAPATQQPDQNTTSLELMNRMKMHGMAEAFRESLAGTTAQSMTPIPSCRCSCTANGTGARKPP